MKIIIATHNPSKAVRYRELLALYPEVTVLALAEIGVTSKIDEPHGSPRENAIHKAREYAALTGEVTLAIDEAVTTDFLPPEEQPGVFVRRRTADRRELTDAEVLVHWREVFDRYPPGEKHFFWDFWIALYDPVRDTTRCTQILQRCAVAERFSEQIDPGYPMSSFLMHEGTTRPYVELSMEERVSLERELFAPFIQEFGGWIRG